MLPKLLRPPLASLVLESSGAGSMFGKSRAGNIFAKSGARSVFGIVAKHNCGLHAKPLRKTMRKRAPPLQKSRRAPKVGGFVANFACGFFGLRRSGTRFLRFFLEFFARRPQFFLTTIS